MRGEAEAASFGYEHFGAAQLGDARRTRRLVRLADSLVKHPGGTLPEKLNQPKELKALYRLVGRKEVTYNAVLETHEKRTIEQARAQAGVVLFIHDTTTLDYSGLKSIKELGQIGNGHGRGYLCHTSLAVAAESGEPLGVARQILFRRRRVPKGETKKERAAQPDRESVLWKRGVEGLARAPEGALWVDVADRGSDITEFLAHEQAAGRRYVVRSQHNRKVVVARDGTAVEAKLHDVARELEAQGRRAIRIAAHDGQKERQALLSVGWTQLEIVPPRQARGEHGKEPLRVFVVRVWEQKPPPGVKPVEWILVTNVAVTTWEEAKERVDWYCRRWTIEEYHKAIKTGCAIEQVQFTSEDRLQSVIALLSVVALSLLWLRSTSREPEAERRRASQRFALEQIRVLSGWRYGEVRENLSIHDFCFALARLGGHQNRRGDGPPGWLVLWRGWTKLQLMVAGAAAIAPKRCG